MMQAKSDAGKEVTAADYGMLMTALPSRQDAAEMAEMLVTERLAACVQLLTIESYYRWEDKVQNALETLMLVKTRTALFEPAIARIKEAHPHSVPEIVATPFTAGFAPYFGWIESVTA